VESREASLPQRHGSESEVEDEFRAEFEQQQPQSALQFEHDWATTATDRFWQHAGTEELCSREELNSKSVRSHRPPVWHSVVQQFAEANAITGLATHCVTSTPTISIFSHRDIALSCNRPCHRDTTSLLNTIRLDFRLKAENPVFFWVGRNTLMGNGLRTSIRGVPRM
jgi:hypothetical protein